MRFDVNHVCFLQFFYPKMCESCCFFNLVSHYIEFVIVYRVDRRTCIFFSNDSMSDFHCESLVLFIFYVICLDLSRSNERELEKTYFGSI